jgi:hypothetical protein
MEYLYETEIHLGIIHTTNATERARAVQGTNQALRFGGSLTPSHRAFVMR